jgi:two-component system, sensor histidine kinase and response regulator
MLTLFRLPLSLWNRTRTIGITPQMDEYEKRKLSVFNQLNVVGILCGIILPIAGIFDQQHLPLIATLVALSPALISSAVLWLNYQKKHELSRFVYFSLYPVITSLVYAAGLNLGVELFFILYGVLAVFYMQRLTNGIIAFAVSMACYLAVFVFMDNYSYTLRTSSFDFYVLNHGIAIICLFFAVSWIKKENNGYQQGILQRNEALFQTNLKIEKQKEEISRKAEQLAELNTVKNKLFSVISHDLKTPMYALRNLFRTIQQHDLNGNEVKLMVPDIVNDLNYTTSLMENLLQWAKSQMQADSIQVQLIDVSDLVSETTQLLRLQAQVKKVYLQNKLDQPIYVYADKDMLNLVLRNIISNAIKFTPEEGRVTIEAADLDTDIEISVSDTGVGMHRDVLDKISGNQFYTSKGTANESGTGLGLMLCKEFLKKIGSRMYIESEYGKGSTFSFVLPKGEIKRRKAPVFHTSMHRDAV